MNVKPNTKPTDTTHTLNRRELFAHAMVRIHMAQHLFVESFLLMFKNVRGNRLRTFLSLLGVTIGIFTIVAVFIVVDSFKHDIQKELSSFDNNLAFVQKWRWGGGPDYPWWVYRSFPEPSYNDFKALKRYGTQFARVTISVWCSIPLQAGKHYIRHGGVQGIWEGHDKMIAGEIAQGRMITPNEFDHGMNVCVLGWDLANKLFPPPAQAVGSTVKVGSHSTQVVGVLEEVRSNLGFASVNDNLFTPYYFARKFTNMNYTSHTIFVEPKPGVSYEDIDGEISRILRAHRRLGTQDIDNFSINRIDTISGQLNQFFRTLNIAGGVIGLLAILVGGFGIVNIMFVSVKERTKEIGIQKSLGAKKYFILTQFLFEAIFLALLGGVLALLLIYILSLILQGKLPFTLLFTLKHIVLGVGLSILIGVFSGYVPAKAAADLDPIKAINSLL